MYGDGVPPPNYQFPNTDNINCPVIESNSDMNYPELVEYFWRQLHVMGLQNIHSFVRLGYKVGSSHNNPLLLLVQ